MFGKRWQGRIVTLFFVLVFTGGALFSCLQWYLPRYLETSLLPGLAEQSGLSVTGSVRRVGLGGADLADLRIGFLPTTSFLEIDSLRIDYSLFGLLNRQIDGIFLGNIIFRVVARDGDFALPGQSPMAEGAGTTGSGSGAMDLASLPLVVKTLALRNGTVVCDRDGAISRFPFTLAASLPPPAQGMPHGAVTFFPGDRELVVQARVDDAGKALRIDIQAHGLKLAALVAHLSDLPQGSVTGNLDLGGKVTMHIGPKLSTEAHLHVKLSDAEVTGGDVSIRQAAETTAHLRLDGEGEAGWRLTGSGFILAEPWALDGVGFESSWRWQDGGVNVDGKVFCQVPVQEHGGAHLAQPLTLSAAIAAARASDGNWRFSFTGDHPRAVEEKVDIRLSTVAVTSVLPDLVVAAAGDGRSAEFSWQVGVATTTAVQADDGTTMTIPALTVQGAGRWPATAGKKLASVAVVVPELHLAKGDTMLTLTGISLPGKLQRAETGISWRGELRVAGGEVSTGEEVGVKVKAFSLALPLQFPCPDRGAAGLLEVGEVFWQDQAMGGVRGELRQKGLGLVVNGHHHSLLLPGLDLSFAGESNHSPRDGFTASGSFAVPEYGFPAPFDLGGITPAMVGLTLNGTIAASGRWLLNRCGPAASLRASLHNGELRMAERGLALEGVDLDLALADLGRMRSEPQQRLRFRKATLGDLLFSDGEIDFQIESADSILLESGRCNWCQGGVEMRSIRFSPTVTAYDLVLYCDRLHFASVLGQLGAATGAAGDGRLNGRIAMHVEKDNLRFDDGFLYSTPGEGGTIRLSGSEQLSAGIPSDTVQFTQVDLAREALKDYTYDWARLSMRSEGEDLLLGLQLNGKPTKPLPFVYRKDIGGFARVEADSPGSVFQGIRLDVNFRLPINTILDYGSSIQDFLR
ncbi:YdbH domain-containing protein [Thermodesulfobacteriota bacterium]